MEEVKQFIIENWKLLASALLFLIAFVVGLIRGKKKGYSLSDILMGMLVEQLPHWISMAEAVGGTGEQKKVQVLNNALNYTARALGRKLTEEETSLIIAKSSEAIEKILNTPQKKEVEKVEVKKNAKYR
jgi:hypothetical protein